MNVEFCSIELRDADWKEFADFGKGITECFVETESEWFSAHFPFVWNYGDEPTDGTGGPPVSNPLEFHLCLQDMRDQAAAIRKYDLRAMLLEDADFLGLNTEYELEPYVFDWVDKTAAALESLASELRALTTKKRVPFNQNGDRNG
jgi:hypothetical protein